jgi:ferredoxin
MKVRVDELLCTGHGRCYAVAPDVFDADDRGYGLVKVNEVSGPLLEQARLAQQNCPERAVILED